MRIKLVITTIFLVFLSNIRAQKFDWGFVIGTYYNEENTFVTRDLSGNTILTGPHKDIVDFNPGSGVNNLQPSHSNCIFMAKYNTNGNYVWAKTFTSGSNSAMEAGDITTDSLGNIYLFGLCSGVNDLDPGPGTYTVNGANYFLLKFNTNGQLLKVRTMPAKAVTIASNTPHRLILDKRNGDMYMTFSHIGRIDLDPGPDSLIENGNYHNATIVKLDSAGNFLWGKRLTSTNINYIHTIDLDDDGNIYLGGAFFNTVNFNLKSGTNNKTSVGSYDIFLAKYTPNGDIIRVVTYGGGVAEKGKWIDVQGDYFIFGGYFADWRIDFDPGPGIKNLTLNSPRDIFLMKMDTAFNLKWVVNSQGNSADRAELDYLKIDKWHNITVVGRSAGIIDLDFGSGVMGFNAINTTSVFASKYDSTGNIFWLRNQTGGTQDLVFGDAYEDENGRLTVTGNYRDAVNLDPNSSNTITSVSSGDMFITNLKGNTILDTAVTICDSFVSPSKKYVWKTTGRYNDTIMNIFGADSVMRFTVTNRTNYLTTNISRCYSYKTTSGKILTQTGIHYDTFVNNYGCKTYQTINLTIIPNSSSNITVKVCDQYISPSGRYLWTITGNYTDTLKNHLGCDSVINIQLQVSKTTLTNVDVTVCGQYISPSGKRKYSYSWVFRDTLKSVFGCDSMLLIDLKVLPVHNKSIIQAACKNYVSPSGKYNWNQSGTYSDTLMNIYGCDSVLTIQLTISQPSSSVLNYSLCTGEKIKVGNKYYLSAGTFRDTILNVSGCDSTMEIVINQKAPIDVAIQKTGRVLKAVKGYDAYQWLGCHNVQYSTINGETEDSLYAEEPGIFAVEITEAGCKDTSICMEIFSTGMDGLSANAMRFYPNPFGENLTFETTLQGKIKISDVNGSLIYELTIENGITHLDGQFLNKGVYTLAFETANQVYYFKLIKL